MGLSEEQQNNLLVSQLLNSISGTNELIQNLSKDIQSNAITLASMKSGLSSLESTVTSLSKILKDGSNGQPPILSRLAVLETISDTLGQSMLQLESTIEDVSKKLIKLRARVDSIEQSCSSQKDIEKVSLEENSKKKDRKIKILVAIWTGLIALIAAVLGSLVSFFIPH